MTGGLEVSVEIDTFMSLLEKLDGILTLKFDVHTQCLFCIIWFEADRLEIKLAT